MWQKMTALAVVLILLLSCNTAKHSQSPSKGQIAYSSIAKPEEIKTDTTKKGKLQPYNKIITSKAISQKGLFTVHKVDDRFYFEIPDSILGEDLLVINRIAQAAAENRAANGMLGYAGDEIGRNVISFEKAPTNKIFVKRISFEERSTDSSENGLYKSLFNSTLQPIVAAFDIKALSADSNAFVIDVTDYLNSDNDVFAFHPAVKKIFGLGAIQNDKSYIDGITAFSKNIEIKTLKTFGTAEVVRTYLLNSSVILLPHQLMQSRYQDDRVGYFYSWYLNYDKNPQQVEPSVFINRWKLEPKEEDVAKYLRGELVEPKKPIVYYVDPATPRKWVPYLIQGVNDWQQAFEKAGFKNAIIAKEVPKGDSISMEDARYSFIVYKPSKIANASGPSITDPRTGEILESHINWYHNVMQLVHDWYMIQAAPNDPKARKMGFDDELMGQLIRFVSSHEVGHTLGLKHNFGASAMVPTDSLRSKSYVEKNGFCPSIMDYARFNYVAQPEDNISEIGIFPRIGVYDEWAIEWGYKWLPQLRTEKESRLYMSNWIKERTSKNKKLWFGNELTAADYRCQSEDLGDDAIKSGTYGIKNLKRVMENLIEWTSQPGENYEGLERLQEAVFDQYQRYIFHVAKRVASVQWSPKTSDEKGVQLSFLSKDEQKESIKFLSNELFETPSWLLNKQIYALTGKGSSYNLLYAQQQVIQKLLSSFSFSKLEFARYYEPKDAYTMDELLTDLEGYILSELKSHKDIDLYRRNLQKVFIWQLTSLFQSKATTNNFGEVASLPWNEKTDMSSILRTHMKQLLGQVNKALPFYNDKETKMHLLDIRDRMVAALRPVTNNLQTNSEDQKAALNLQIPEYQKLSQKIETFTNCKECTMWIGNLKEY